MSGGIDSTACAHFLMRQGVELRGVFIDYGQGAAKFERRAVVSIAACLGISVAEYVISGSDPFSSGELTGRNAFLAFTALFFAREKSGLLAMGLHAGTPYYDCSVPFVASLSKVIAEHTDGRVSFVAPFVTWSKREVFEYFSSGGVPLHLTYSCETGGQTPCGTCASCRDRAALGC